jgi:hypothetical protein
MSCPSQTREVTLAAGQTVTVQMGGVGRPVTGRLVLPAGMDSLKSYFLQSDVIGTSLAELPARGPQGEPTQVEYVMELVGDQGQFKIDDVVPGHYQIHCMVRAKLGGQPYGQARVEFTMPPVPGGYSDQPLVIADIILKAR